MQINIHIRVDDYGQILSSLPEPKGKLVGQFLGGIALN